jgi:hypothetical protein
LCAGGQTPNSEFPFSFCSSIAGLTIRFQYPKYEVTVEDSGAYTRPWSGGFILRWNSGAELFEYICQENNLVEETNDGADGSVRRTRPITP